MIADNSGVISATWHRNGLTSWGAFNALQIVDANEAAAPEPSAIVLAGSALFLAAAGSGLRRSAAD